ncbi:MAG: tryptophan transporter [Bacillota bacterium]|nr:tryptophan transporter [Bacillota bacterium]
MRLRDLIVVALLMAIGYILHSIPFWTVGGMRPDFMLVMLISAVLLLPEVYLAAEAGVLAGIITALTTTFPGGQVGNFVDKICTAFVVLALARLLRGRINAKILAPILGAVGTLISGAIFLGVARLVALPPAPFGVLYTTVVLPTALLNTIGTGVIYPLLEMSRQAVQGGSARRERAA